MKRFAYPVLSVLFFGAIAYCIYHFRVELGIVRPPGGQGLNPGGSGNYASDHAAEPYAWQIIDRIADGFKVELPGTPIESRVPSYTSLGSVEPVEMIAASPDPETTFAVTWADNPPVERAGTVDAERTLDLARDGALAHTQTILISEAKGSRQGYPLRDFISRNPSGGTMNARLILAGTRLYMLIAAFPASSPPHGDDVHRFFNSFLLAQAARSN